MPKTWDYLAGATFEKTGEHAASFEAPRVWVHWNGIRYCLKVASLDAPADLAAGDLVSVLVLPGGIARIRKTV